MSVSVICADGEYRLLHPSVGVMVSRCPWHILKRAGQVAKMYNVPVTLSDEAAIAIAILAEESID